MTVATTQPYNTYAGNGATIAFAYTTKILADTDVKALLVKNNDKSETLQVLNTHYVVDGVGNVSGPTLTFLVAPPTGYTVTLLPSPSVIQPTDLKSGGPYDPVVVENSLDRRNFIEQMVKFLVDKCIQAPAGEIPAAGDLLLPPTLTRASKALIFDALGKVTVGDFPNQPVSTGTFTPTLRGSTAVGTPTYVAQVGKYTKMGKWVFVSGYVEISSKLGITGLAQIGGLPFAMSADASYRNPISIAKILGIDFGATLANSFLAAYIDPSGQVINLEAIATTVASVLINIAQVANATKIGFSGCYMTD